MGRQATPEQYDLMGRFYEMLWGPTGDGATKRSKGEKDPWYIDDGHLIAGFRHLIKGLGICKFDDLCHQAYESLPEKWHNAPMKEEIDPDSGEHHFAHAAWRFLAEMGKITGNTP